MTNPSGDALRILLVTKGLDIGGIERMVVGLSMGLQQRGHHVEVALVNDRRDRLAPELESAGIEVHRLRGTDRIGWRGATDLAQLARSDRFDVVHVHGPLPSVVARLTPGASPIVTTSHTPIEALHPLTRWAWRATLWRDAATVAVGVGVAGSIRGVVVIPHAARERNAPEPALLDSTSASASALNLVTVASHRHVKNYPVLFEAVRQARAHGVDLRLVAVGEGSELERNIAVAASLGLTDIVKFRPPHTAVLDDIAAADVLVVSSDYEGQPLVVSEALAVGTPVIATDVGRVSELVDDEVGRVVSVGDSAALAAALIELDSSRMLRAAMGAAAIRRASKWTPSDAVAAHEALYRRVCGR